MKCGTAALGCRITGEGACATQIYASLSVRRELNKGRGRMPAPRRRPIIAACRWDADCGRHGRCGRDGRGFPVTYCISCFSSARGPWAIRSATGSRGMTTFQVPSPNFQSAIANSQCSIATRRGEQALHTDGGQACELRLAWIPASAGMTDYRF
jgi:hypothetical protein